MRSNQFYKGAVKVFAWSFYSQGSHTTSTTSSLFFQDVLSFLGFQGELPKDESNKGQILAEYLKRQPFILILDGLEPLQHPVHFLDGRLKDNALRSLFSHLRRMKAKNSLVLISSRQKLYEFYNWRLERYQQINLETLDIETGVAVLQYLGVEGKLDELQAASNKVGGHALALVLLGKMLVRHHQRNIRYIDQLPDLFAEKEDGSHAMRVMKWYVEYWDTDAPELIFLKILGLFDKPMTKNDFQLLFLFAKLRVFIREHSYTDAYTKMIRGELPYTGITLMKAALGEEVSDEEEKLEQASFDFVRGENKKLHIDLRKLIDSENLHIPCRQSIIQPAFEYSEIDYNPSFDMWSDLQPKIFHIQLSLLEPFVRYSDTQLENIWNYLVKIGLVSLKWQENQEWDTHPIVRAYFGNLFKDESETKPKHPNMFNKVSPIALYIQRRLFTF